MPVSSMSNDWASPHQEQTVGSREYETTAELWLSNKNGAFTGTRKLQTQQRRKNNDKRDSVAQLTALTEGSPKKLKEKPSWLGMARGYATTASAAGRWVPVRCSLTEGASIVTLNIIGDKGTLQHALYVNKLNATDIRFADRSLFCRNDCLAIQGSTEVFARHSPSHQTLISTTPDLIGSRQAHRRQQSSSPALDPLYLAFESKDAVNCWSALLRSYAKPEIYGRHITHGGLYRMWRQVDLKVMAGRNLGASGKLVSTDGLASIASLQEVERGESPIEGATDMEIYCEVVLDGILHGQTTMKKGQTASPTDSPNWTWLEGFTLSDLPPFGILSVRVWREKKSPKPALVGTVEMVLSNFPRGHFVEGWYPVLSTGNGIQVGEIRLKIKVDEEIILPSEAYAAISSTLDSRNCLDLLGELDQKMQLFDLSSQPMLSLAVGRGTFMDDLFELAEREVNNAPNANTLFRGNTVFTKTVEQAMSFFGRSFLEASVGPCIQELCMHRVEIETDPSRNPNRPKDVEASVKLLPMWCSRFWTQIYQVRGQCPLELRRLFQHIRDLVETRFGTQTSNLRWQSVSAFCFLRLIVPGILHPHLFGLHPGLPSVGLQRSLTLIAKTMQSLANLSREQKEKHMQGVEGFLEDNIPAMTDYINEISTPLQDRGHPDVSDKYNRLQIIQSMRERARTLSPLTSEAIPRLPHLLDIPKHLAILSSAVVRHARNAPQSVTSRPAPLAHESLVEDFAIKCFEIESKAVQCVSRLASPPKSATAASRHSRRVPSRRSSSPSRDDHETERIKRTPLTPVLNNDVPHTPDSSRHRRKSSRPSTAPAAASSSSSSTFDTPLPSPPLASPITFARPAGRSMDTSPISPSTKFFRKRPPSSPSAHTSASATAPSSPPFPTSSPTSLRRTLSQQLPLSREPDNIEEAAAKRRGWFLRSLLSRTSK